MESKEYSDDKILWYHLGQLVVSVSCPKCDSNDLECEDTPEKLECQSCGLDFTVKMTAIWS